MSEPHTEMVWVCASETFAKWIRDNDHLQRDIIVDPNIVPGDFQIMRREDYEARNEAPDRGKP